MTTPLIHSRRGFIPASSLLEAAGSALRSIKNEDGLTWKDIGEALGKSEDQASKYAEGLATMDFVTFFRACEHWNGRFANSIFALGGMTLCDNISNNKRDGIRQGMLNFTELMVGLQRAMLDEKLTDDEVDELGTMIETAGKFIDQLRCRLSHIRSGGELKAV